MLGIVMATYQEFAYRVDILVTEASQKPDRVQEIVQVTTRTDHENLEWERARISARRPWNRRWPIYLRTVSCQDWPEDIATTHGTLGKE